MATRRTERRDRTRNQSKRRVVYKKKSPLPIRLLKWLGMLCLIVLVVVGLLGFKVYQDVKVSADKAYDPASSQIHLAPVDYKNKSAFTTLVVGTSTIKGDTTATAVVLVAVNPKTKKTTMMNLSPDIYLPDSGELVSQLYATQGIQGMIDKVQGLFGVQISSYELVDMDGLGDLVEAAGGITLENEKPFIAGGYEFAAGTTTLDKADQVKAYMTLLDGESQKAYFSRQQNVGMTLYSQLKSKDTVFKYKGLLEAVAKHVKTSIRFKDAKTIVLKDYKALLHSSKINVHSKKEVIDGGLTQKILTEEERARVAAEFAQRLQ